MITTCTLNPAIDKFAICKNFKLDSVNTVESYQESLGGKGINVAIVLKSLGLSANVCGLIGKKNSDVFTNKLKELNIINDLTQIEGETRFNIKIESKDNITTDINFPALNCTLQDIENITEKIKQKNSKYIVLGGSLPASLPKDTYAKMIEKLKTKDNKIILDSSKDALKLSLNSNIYLIKPNIDELEEICNKKLESTESIIKAGLEIVNQGVENIIVSLGSKGALFINNKQVFKVKAPKTEALSTVGAGDTMVASFLASIVYNKTFLDAAKFAVAMSAFKVTKRGVEITQEEIDTKVKQNLENLEITNY